MKPRFVRCEFCKTEIPLETCKLATYTTTIDGEEYSFCCVRCAERYKQKKAKKNRAKTKNLRRQMRVT